MACNWTIPDKDNILNKFIIWKGGYIRSLPALRYRCVPTCPTLQVRPYLPYVTGASLPAPRYRCVPTCRTLQVCPYLPYVTGAPLPALRVHAGRNAAASQLLRRAAVVLWWSGQPAVDPGRWRHQPAGAPWCVMQGRLRPAKWVITAEMTVF